MCVIWPEAIWHPSFEMAMHVTRSVWPGGGGEASEPGGTVGATPRAAGAERRDAAAGAERRRGSGAGKPR